MRVAEPTFLGNELAYVTDCVRRRQVSGAEYVEQFEHAFASWVGVQEAVATTSGTTALHLALLALGVGPGQEVIVPDLTFVATANAVRMCGAEPVLCDVTPGTWTLDPCRARELITGRTTGIIPVHLYGVPCEMVDLFAMANTHGLFLLEDAAEAPGARWRGLGVGALGICAAFSFYGNKILTTGEGGMVTTDDNYLAQRMRRLRGQGMDPQRRYWHTDLGYNYRMMELQGALGLAQVEQAAELVARRQAVADWYREETGPWQWQAHQADTEPVWWMNVALLDEGIDRDAIIADMAMRDIECRPTFYPLHKLPMYQRNGDWPVASDVARRGIALPSHGNMTPAEVEWVCAALRAGCHA